jgi:two-component sensor histidine kinase
LLEGKPRDSVLAWAGDRPLVGHERAELERLSLAVEAGQLAIWEWDLETDRVTWNDRLYELFLVEDRGSVVNVASVLERVDARDRGALRRAIEEARNGDDMLLVEFRVPLPDGGTRYVCSRGRKLHSTRHRREVMVGVSYDITERRRAEDRRRRISNLLSSAERLAKIGSWELRLPDTAPLMSEQLYRMLGVPVGKPLSLDGAISFYLPEYRPLVRERLAALIEHGTPMDLQARLRTATGETKWVRVLGTADLEPTGVIACAYGSVQDISDQKAAERTLRDRAMVNKLFMRELDHRIRNNISTILSIVESLSSDTCAGEELASALRDRIGAMLEVHDLLSASHADTIGMRDIIDTALRLAPNAAITAVGPDTPVPAKQVASVALVIAELIGNSARYGSLSHTGGSLALRWHQGAAEAQGAGAGGLGTAKLTIEAAEHHPPGVRPRVDRGIGIELIEGIAVCELDGHASIEHDERGMRCTLDVRLHPGNDGEFGHDAVCPPTPSGFSKSR